MFHPLKLYYLQQMGITPWILKGSYPEAVKLIILIKANISQKESALLHRLLAYLELTEQEKKVLPADNHNDLSSLTCHHILSFGVAMDCLNFEQNCVQLPDLQHLLDNPVEKKGIFLELTTLKSVIS